MYLFLILFLFVMGIWHYESNTIVNVPSHQLVRFGESDHAEYQGPLLAVEIFTCFPGLVSLGAENDLLAHDYVFKQPVVGIFSLLGTYFKSFSLFSFDAG